MTRTLLPLGVVLGGALLAAGIFYSAPRPERRSAPPQPVSVEVQGLKATDHQVLLRTQGTVRPHMQSTLAAEVRGRVAWISPSLQDGAFVADDEVLLRIDPREYELALAVAKETAAAAGAGLAELGIQIASVSSQIALAHERIELEERRLSRAEELHGQGVVSDDALIDAQVSQLAARESLLSQFNLRRSLTAKQLTLRRSLAVAAQRQQQNELDLARTEVRSPFRGRVVRREVGKGHYLTPGVVLATVYAVDHLEVRLPLSAQQLAFFPEGGDPARVELRAQAGVASLSWVGRVVRTEGVVDRASRQTAVIAEIEQRVGDPPLRPGTFVTARIHGTLLEGVFEVPRAAGLGEDVVLVVDAQQQVVRRRPVEVVWRTPELLVVSGGLQDGELMCTTPLVFGGDELKVSLGGERQGKPGKAPR